MWQEARKDANIESFKRVCNLCGESNVLYNMESSGRGMLARERDTNAQLISQIGILLL